jgi:hypothetical protein
VESRRPCAKASWFSSVIFAKAASSTLIPKNSSSNCLTRSLPPAVGGTGAWILVARPSTIRGGVFGMNHMDHRSYGSPRKRVSQRVINSTDMPNFVSEAVDGRRVV